MTKLPTATMSVCATLEEAQMIRDAATTASLTVSAWANSRAIMALASAANRARAAEVAKRIKQHPVAKGARSSRVSMVMRAVDHASLKDAAAALQLDAHGFAQAILLEAAESELKDLPMAERVSIEQTRKALQAAGTFLVSVPKGIDLFEVNALSQVVRQLIVACSKDTLNGKGPTIAAGATKLAASRAQMDHVTIKLIVPEFDMRAVAYVLEIPPATLATALTLKAARVLEQARAA